MQTDSHEKCSSGPRRVHDVPDEIAPVVGELEQEFAFLARALEAVHRKRAYPLERAHYLLLLQLREGPRTIGDLSTALALDDSTVTRQVGAMLKRKLVRKLANPADGRSALVERTPEGASSAEEMRLARLHRIARLFAHWSETDRQCLAEMLARVNADLSAYSSAIEEPGGA
nr:MarR family transcriptional regulator [Afifella sp. IM 167]